MVLTLSPVEELQAGQKNTRRKSGVKALGRPWRANVKGKKGRGHARQRRRMKKDTLVEISKTINKDLSGCRRRLVLGKSRHSYYGGLKLIASRTELECRILSWMAESSEISSYSFPSCQTQRYSIFPSSVLQVNKHWGNGEYPPHLISERGPFSGAVMASEKKGVDGRKNEAFLHPPPPPILYTKKQRPKEKH